MLALGVCQHLSPSTPLCAAPPTRARPAMHVGGIKGGWEADRLSLPAPQA